EPAGPALIGVGGDHQRQQDDGAEEIASEPAADAAPEAQLVRRRHDDAGQQCQKGCAALNASLRGGQPVRPLLRIQKVEIGAEEGDDDNGQDEDADGENLDSDIPEEEAAKVALARYGCHGVVEVRHRPALRPTSGKRRIALREASARPLRCSIPHSDPAAFAAALCTYDTPGDGRLESGTSRTQAARLRRRPASGWPAEAVSRNPSACITLSTVANSGCPSADSALYRLSRPRPA